MPRLSGDKALSGVAEMRGKFRQLSQTMPQRLGDGLYRAMQPTALKAREITPIETGLLRSTVKLEGPEVQKTIIRVALVAGNARTRPYDVIVHENLRARHKPPTQAKYVEQPLFEDKDVIMQRAVEFSHL